MKRVHTGTRIHTPISRKDHNNVLKTRKMGRTSKVHKSTYLHINEVVERMFI